MEEIKNEVLKTEIERLKMKIVELTKTEENMKKTIQILERINQRLQAENELYKNMFDRVKSIKFKE